MLHFIQNCKFQYFRNRNTSHQQPLFLSRKLTFLLLGGLQNVRQGARKPPHPKRKTTDNFVRLRFFKSVLTERILAPFGIIDIFSKCCMKPTKRCPKVFETVLLVLAASKTHQSHLHGRQTPLLVLNVTHELSIL